MKSIITLAFLILTFTLSAITLHAQTEKKTGAGSKVGDANSKTDIYQGKKIEQQNLSKPFEKITDTIAPAAKKKTRKTKHKQAP